MLFFNIRRQILKSRVGRQSSDDYKCSVSERKNALANLLVRFEGFIKYQKVDDDDYYYFALPWLDDRYIY